MPNNVMTCHNKSNTTELEAPITEILSNFTHIDNCWKVMKLKVHSPTGCYLGSL